MVKGEGQKKSNPKKSSEENGGISVLPAQAYYGIGIFPC